MKIVSFLLGIALLPASSALLAGNVFIAETPGHTRFFIDDAAIMDIGSPEGNIRQAIILTERPRKPQDGSAKVQVRARALMQFKCANRSYREIETAAFYSDGTAQIVVPRSEQREFSSIAPGSFEEKIADAACKPRS